MSWNIGILLLLDMRHNNEKAPAVASCGEGRSKMDAPSQSCVQHYSF